MTQQTKYKIIIIILISFLIIGLIIHYLSPFFAINKEKDNITNAIQGTHSANNIQIKIDTVYKVMPAEPIYIAGNAIIKYKTDTLISVKHDTTYIKNSYIATLDTIVKRDTINLKYEYPKNYFALNVRQKPDSILIQRIEIFTIKEKERPWYELPAYITGSIFVGYIFGGIK
jgi:hypothetical protein